VSDLHGILAAQNHDGSFPARAHFTRPGRPSVPDANAFVTVHVVRCLMTASLSGPASAGIDRALEYLQRCRHRPGAYGFWPSDSWPAWAPRFGPDADDTALLAGTLLTAGWMTDSDVDDCVAELSRDRISIDRPAPEWLRPAAFGTWLDQPGLVDCTVNANVVAFLAQAGWADWRRCRAVLAMIDNALEWSRGSWPRLVSLSPFYPDPTHLRAALARAATAGASGAAAVLARSEEVLAGTPPVKPPPAPPVVCCSAYGVVRWTSPVLQAAHALTTTVSSAPGTPAG
jgi:hypothetical protein